MPVSCYLCGRDFGTRSIGIHVPHCVKKWEDEQKKMPRSKRRSPPEPPEKLDRVIEGQINGKELKEFNEAAIKMWKTAVLVECKHCHRTFFPHKLGKHQTSCTEDRPMENPNKTKGNASRQEALMNYSEQNKMKYKKRSSKPQNDPKDVSKPVSSSKENIGNLIDKIKDNQALQDKELSSQLLHIMDYLIESKLKCNPHLQTII